MQLSDFPKLTVLELMDYLTENYYIPVPEEINTIEKAEEAARTMAKYANGRVYLNMVKNYLDALHREDKTNKNLIVLKNTVSDFADDMKLQYQALSRQITIRQGNLEELHMSDNYTINKR